MAKYYRVVSNMKQGVGCDYVIKTKGSNNTVIHKSIIIYIPGSGIADINGVSKIIPDVFINKKEHDLLRTPLKDSKTGIDKPSVFSFLIEQRIKEPKKGGIVVQDCGFNDLPDEKKKEYDPAFYTKLDTLRKKKEQEVLDTLEDEEKKDD